MGISFTLALAAGAARAEGCGAAPATELERLFCQLKAERPAELPYDLREFRNNPPATQRLLLKRPAARAGRTLPDAPPVPARAAPAAPSPPAPPSAPATPVAPAAVGLSGCKLAAEAITCPGASYKRMRNGRLDQAPEALVLAPITDANRPDSYAAYVTAMLALGLSEEAMSYTKFSHFAGLESDYHQRLGTMYRTLLAERASIAAPPRRRGGPAGLDACFQLTPELIVCDDVSSTWIYARRD